MVAAACLAHNVDAHSGGGMLPTRREDSHYLQETLAGRDVHRCHP